MATARLATLIVWSLGVAVLIGLTLWSGAGLVGQAILDSGWAVAAVVLIRISGVAGAGAGWWLLFPADIRPRLPALMGIRFIREATNAILPLAQIGGDFIGARCLALRGTRGSVAAASVMVDVLVQAATMVAFALIGLTLLLVNGGSEIVAWSAGIGIGIAIPALAAFFVAQSEHGHRLITKALTALAGGREWRVFGAVDELFAQLQRFYANRIGLVRSFFWHLADWFVGVVEVWIVLNFMGYAISIEQALIIESLMQAVRGAAFAIPGALGAQEGGLIVLCAMYGIPPDAAVALSLVKRIPDFVIGIPGVLAWQAMEGRNFFRRSAARSQTGGPERP
ncbi:MAG: flippase-like domain-containing protein [Alphaproteobacteria bacterium]|nr:flippase-like domain-containing protein [Alphaproteobacteria bacterium]